MRVLFTKNHHVETGERSRQMYKRGHEYDVADDVAKAAIDAKRARPVTDRSATSLARSKKT